MGQRKFDQMVYNHMTNLAAMPIYVKNLKKSHLLWNRKADDHEN